MVNEQTSYLTLEPLFNPKVVAVLGASENKNKIGYLQVKALLDSGYKGDIYPINPKSEMIEGLMCYPSLSDVPKHVDLAFFCVSADKVKSCLEDCGKSKVKTAVIFASGFSEAGKEGLKEQQLMNDIAKENGVRIIGPNCVGLVNTTNGLMGTFSPGLTNIPFNDQKEVGFITQSGAFGVLTYIAAAQHGLTFNYFISVGNEVNTEFSDVIEYMIYDPDTSVISGYLEGEKNPKKLRKLAQQALHKNKPIIIMKSGRSSAGSRAAASHTGSLAGSDKIYDGFFKQTGIIRADDYEDIISFSKLFLSKKLPTGRNTVIITSSGGRGINEADRCESYGLNIHALNEKTKLEIQKSIPDFASASNPVDLTAAAAITNPELFIAPMKALINDSDTDIIVFSEFPMEWDENNPLLEEFIKLCKSTDKFVLVTTFPLEGMSVPKAAPVLAKNGIPFVPGNLNPVRALAKLVNYSEKYYKTKLEVNQTIEQNNNKENLKDLLPPGVTLSESQASNILDSYGIPTTKKAVAKSVNEAIQHASHIGYPVVLKVDSPDIPHKSEANAIKLNLRNDKEVIDAFKEINQHAVNYNPNARINGVSVQEMLPEGVEIIVGVTNDTAFGPVIMLGLGGIFVEVFKDISFRVAPITRNDAIEMIDELKSSLILKGARGKSPVDIDAIVDVLLKVSALVSNYGDEIKELDINPLIVYEKGIIAADAMLVVHEEKNNTTVVGR
ncbi:acetyltransferase [Virgibacillus halotolerans]|uniref:acetate--CoA ligase family protein n=1 Tax=Virgibacillus halotolerans TaxID=1071053 RepID=UPI00196057AE|nr:acetate--CoA ligase family protein [Virgibacillus halotolerans]MBM7599973.1 acetyltransferase [Virgibacillus halotolerans]